VKRLTVALLILGAFASTALAQYCEQVMKDRRRVLGGWLGTVRRAELKYKSTYGVYADLTALRNADLLDALVFESDKPTEPGQDTNLVPRSAHFEVTPSSNGEHYKVSISEDIFGEWGIGVSADEMSAGYSVGHRRLLPPGDGLEGP
jgi:hypothetical protein